MEALRIEVSGRTDVGRKRNHNEDNYALFPEHGLFIVADGMGGHASGEIASKLAVETMYQFFEQTRDDPERTWPYKMDRGRGYEENRLVTSIKLGNLRIFERAQSSSKQRGMGTTVVAAFCLEERVYIAHVGDSRVYRIRDGRIEQLTEDHSLLNDYRKMKRLSDEEVANFPHKNVIVRALGMKDSVKVDTQHDTPREGDLLLLCTDGLAGPVSDPEIFEVVKYTDDLDEATRILIDKANAAGGPDNITVVLARWRK